MRPKGKLIAHTDTVEYLTHHGEGPHRYDTYANWDFLSWTAFLDTPIREWLFKPRVVWIEYERGFFWLWFGCRWSKTYRYVERPEWIQCQLQKKLNILTNMQLDNIRLSRRN